MTTDSIPQIIILVILVLFSAYFSATETAFSSLNKTRIKTLVEKGNKRAKLVLKLSDDYDKLLSAILIGNNIVNISMASIATVLFISLYGDIGATISTAVITVVVLIFGEISPKSLAKDSPEKFAMFSAPFISMLIVILTPLNFIFSQWKKLLSNEYKQFKEISARMHQLEEDARALMTKLPEEYPLPPPNIEITGLTLEKLAKAFRKVLERAEAAEKNEHMASREIRRDSFTVAGCMAFISRRLRGGSFRFVDLFEDNYTREEVITMFLAVLEMARLNRVHVKQSGAYSEIYLSA